MPRLALTTGCSLKTMAVKSVANTLSDTGDVFTRDDDPELIRDATPFALKLYESLLDSVPITCRCSSPRAAASRSTATPSSKPKRRPRRQPSRRGRAPRARAQALPARTRLLPASGGGALRQGHQRRAAAGPGHAPSPRPERTMCRCSIGRRRRGGAAISLGIDRPDLVVDFPTVRALADRALALDETWSKGALHEMLISLDSLPRRSAAIPSAPASTSRRRSSSRRACRRAPMSRWRPASSVPAQDRAEYERLLKEALAIDPEKDPSNRLVTLVTSGARALLDRSTKSFEVTRPGGLLNKESYSWSKSRYVICRRRRRRSRGSLWAAVNIKMATQAPVNSSWHKALLEMGAAWKAKTAAA